MMRIVVFVLALILGTTANAAGQWKEQSHSWLELSRNHAVQSDSASNLVSWHVSRFQGTGCCLVVEPEGTVVSKSNARGGAMFGALVGGVAGFGFGFLMENLINEGKWTIGKTAITGTVLGTAAGALVGAVIGSMFGDRDSVEARE